MEFRKVFVLREIEIDMREIKKGDIFRMEPATTSDFQAEPNQYHLAADDAFPTEHEENFGVECSKIEFVKTERILVPKLKSIAEESPLGDPE